MSSTKQAKSQGNSGKEPILHQVIDWRKKPWEKPDSVGGQLSSGQRMCSAYDYVLGNITGQKSDLIRTFTIFIQFHLVGGWSHHASMETIT